MKENILKTRPRGASNFMTGRALYLAIALGAILTFLVLVTLKFSGVNDSELSHEVQKRNSLEKEYLDQQEREINEGIQAKLPVERDKMLVPTADALKRIWVTSFDSGATATMRFDGEVFDLIYTVTSDARVRKYSRGHYSYNEKTGQLTLTPSRALGAPRPVEGVTYKILTMRRYEINVSQKRGGESIFLVAPDYQIIPKSYHPLFSYADFVGSPVIKFSPFSTKQKR